MRPTRLELSGFTSFREPTVVDLTDVDLFVLSGPTGAGKCLPGDALVFDSQRGQRVPIERFVRECRRSTLGPVNGRFQPVPVSAWHDLGEKDTVLVTLENGARLHAATTHPVLTDEGCVAAGELQPGCWVAQARSLPEVGPSLINADEAFALGCLLGDGTLTHRQHLGFANVDRHVVEALQQALDGFLPGVELRASDGGLTYRFANRLRGDDRRAYVLALFERLEAKGIDLRSVLGPDHVRVRRSGTGLSYATLETIEDDYGIDLHAEKCTLWANLAARDWLVQMGAFGHGASTKRLPDWAPLQGEDVLWRLLAGLIATDGTVNRANVEFSTSSEGLARDVQLLSMRLGLSPTLSMERTRQADAWRLAFDVSSVLSMAQHMDIPGPKGSRLRDVAAEHAVPTTSPDGPHDRTHQQSASSRMSRELSAIPGGEPARWENDYRWSKVVSVRSAGRQRCYDLTVDTAEHLYLSESFVVHNSSLIDAMTFALYGSVPRYDNKSLVAPVISQGRVEARVRLDFAVGEQAYTATRVVRRTKTGASTKEARLERATGSGTVVLADNADQLTTAVTELLGLTFDHFTTCVVLPQGAFQAFMHAKPKERQDLLVELLELDIYRRIASMARDQAARDEMEVQLLDRQLEGELAEATPAARDAAAARIETLERLRERIETARPQLEAITEQGRELRARATTAREQRDQLGRVRVPDGVEELAERLRHATETVERTEATLAEATAAREDTDRDLESLPDPATLRDLVAAVERTGELVQAEATAAEALTSARAEVERTRSAVAESARATAEARDALERAHRRDLVHTLVDGLSPGQDCPVCTRPLDEVPDPGPAAATEAARATLSAAETAEQQARAKHQAAEAASGRAEAQLDAAVRDRRRHRTELEERADRFGLQLESALIRERISEVEARHRAAASARTAERQARQARDAALGVVRSLGAERDAGWRAFDTVRDAVASLSPPSVRRGEADLAEAWAALASWAAETAPVLEQQARKAEAAVDEAAGRYRQAQEELWQACADEGLERRGSDPREVCVEALHREQHRLERLERALARAEQVRIERDAKRSRARLARELGTQLHARRFEQWLLNRALHRLVGGASRILHELSQGNYSLTLDASNVFQVVDHRNADESRSARTLSGGETFLASLALALALSEHITDLAAQGTARLDALFIDEGFGTLDADTLDTVAAAIEELGSRGRMVGLVTHVQDLAERFPVRYQITKAANTSSVVQVTT